MLFNLPGSASKVAQVSVQTCHNSTSNLPTSSRKTVELFFADAFFIIRDNKVDIIFFNHPGLVSKSVQASIWTHDNVASNLPTSSRKTVELFFVDAFSTI
jgi:hypothetical protein